MCLDLGVNNSQELIDKQIKWNTKGKEEIFVYKVLQKTHRKNTFNSIIYNSTYWTLNKAKTSSRGKKKRLTENELKWGFVDEGLHFYSTRRRARITRHNYSSGFRIIKCLIKTKDIVAYSRNNELVAIRAIPIKVIY